MVWLALGGAVIVTVVAVILLQKKSKQINKLSEELALCQRERDKKSGALEKLENSFEEQMDQVVQSSIEKISHAEHAKEEAVKAASDNFEVASETHALLKEKEALIRKLQGG